MNQLTLFPIAPTATVPAAVDWCRRVVHDVGEDLGGGLYAVRFSQADLNQREGRDRNCGLVARYLRQLGAAVVQRRPYLIFDIRQLDQPSPEPELAAAVASLAGAVIRLVSAQSAHHPRSAEPRIERKGSSNKTFLPPSPGVCADDIDQLLEPLHDLVRRCPHLTPLTDPAGVHRALAPYTRAEIRHAVELIRRRVEADTRLHSPFGLLVREALASNPAYFTTPTTKPEAGGRTTPPPPAGVPRPTDLEPPEFLRRLDDRREASP